MTQLAHWLHRNTPLSALLLFALLLRALVPAGHMLDAGGSGVPLKLCSGATWQGNNGPAGSDDAGSGARPHAPGCSFAAADVTPLAATDAWFQVLPWPTAPHAASVSVLPTPLQSQGRARLPRGPPVLSA
ncbi:MAG: hypothetical protein RL026_2492 [Pseudomonadota bacterium]